jgi:hypothetical protein
MHQVPVSGGPLVPFRATEGLAGFGAHELANGVLQQRLVGHHDPRTHQPIPSWRQIV